MSPANPPVDVRTPLHPHLATSPGLSELRLDAEGGQAFLFQTRPGVQLAAADGGFEVKVVNGQHREHLQELFSGQIVLAECLVAFKALSPGGVFVCKLFDSFSHLTVSLVYLAAVLFEKVVVVKPPHSRLVRVERCGQADMLCACTLRTHFAHFPSHRNTHSHFYMHINFFGLL